MSPDDEKAVLAGEYVLGLLTEEERAWVERQSRHDLELDQAILAWQEELLPLDQLPAAEVPDAALWERIEGSLWPLATATAAAPARRPAPAPLPRRPGRARPQPGLLARLDRASWSSLAFWRVTGFVAAAAALVLAVVTTLEPPATLPVPVAVTVLVGRENQVPGWIVEAYPNATFQVLPLVDTPVPPDRALQLWTLRDPAQGPLSMGLVPPGGVPQFAVGSLPPVEAGQLFEISLEPATGSPTGRPTGPVLFIGRAAQPPR